MGLYIKETNLRGIIDFKINKNKSYYVVMLGLNGYMSSLLKQHGIPTSNTKAGLIFKGNKVIEFGRFYMDKYGDISKFNTINVDWDLKAFVDRKVFSHYTPVTVEEINIEDDLFKGIEKIEVTPGQTVEISDEDKKESEYMDTLNTNY